ncbi:MAG: DUF1800 domain-containing protein [Rickettsiales bacterium]|nr:DUF1800 domain-containing protein [Rickettsiales bacterium]
MSNNLAFHASARFGLGAKPGELATIGSDPRGWLMQQLRSPVIPREVQKREGGADLMAQAVEGLRAAKLDKAENKIRAARDIYIKETGARVIAQVRSEQPFIERMVLFWSNHFTVSVQKPIIGGIVNQYEVEAIRPHIGGYFKDMLLAVCRHPAMLFYLDNVQSFGANSRAGTRRGKGLNENLAREILELHTLGVGSGYTQNDVIALAKIITGWTLDRSVMGVKIAFKFQELAHEPGAKTLLGKNFAESGEQEGIDALTMLAAHPATAKHIATKLARHFIADTPSAGSIAAIERVFLQTDGHIPSVMQSIIAMDDAWNAPLTKLKNPYEFVISALRLTGVEPTPIQAVIGLEALNFRAFNAPSPAGFDDVAEAWASPDALMKRIEWGHKLAQRLPAGTSPMQLAELAMKNALSAGTTQAIERAASGTDGIGLLLASPEFQRR